jgi:hypothetical protein
LILSAKLPCQPLAEKLLDSESNYLYIHLPLSDPVVFSGKLFPQRVDAVQFKNKKKSLLNDEFFGELPTN